MNIKNYSRKIKNFLFFVFIFSVFLQNLNVYAETYVLGGKEGWSQVQKRNGVTTGKGRFGYESLELATNQRKIEVATDILLNFEDGQIKDQVNNYSVQENNLFITEQAYMGKCSGLSRGKNGGLELKGNGSSFFSQEGPTGSFMIDFWICPSLVENGEVILKWRSSKSLNGQIDYQLITISFYQDKLMCVFSNIFEGYTKNNGDVYLLGTKKLIPQKWTHHSIAYTQDDGCLLYKLDGEIEDIKFLTTTEHEGGTVYQSVIGKGSNLIICPEYSGLIDDFCVMRSFIDIKSNILFEDETSLRPTKYVSTGGRIESNPIMLKKGTTLNKIIAETYIPSQTEIDFFVRSGDNYFNWTDSYPEWIPVKNSQELQNVKGMYFQVAANLYTDGNASKSPSISKIELDYTLLPEIHPPYSIKTQKGDSCVTLTWSYSVNEDVGGYYVYYGTRSGEYLGRVALEGVSPINVGNSNSITLHGLKNGTIYYFAISAWPKGEPDIRGPLSKEVYSRPGK